jgi:hypothetical protein
MNDDVIKKWVYFEEVRMNPYYDINPEIEITNRTENTINYRVQCISKIEPNRWRNWYSKTIMINSRDILQEMRDKRIDEILDEN